MSSDIANKWHKSRRYALINGEYLRPVSNHIIKDTPLSIQCGQAEVYVLKTKNDERKYLKVFYDNKRPSTKYLNSISSILPKQEPFRCGLERQVLTNSSLSRNSGSYCTNALANWLNNTILMPQIPGKDWISLTDDIRRKKIHPDGEQRRLLCWNLATVTKYLEEYRISHRDYSSGNIYIDIDFDNNTCQIYLIDLDSPYHPNLPMPKNTTIGSDGYIAPFVNQNNARITYCPNADRFAMTILCIEFLLLKPSSPCFHEGGIFSQQEISQRYGKTISDARANLKKTNPKALELFKRAINSNSFEDCPSPDDWINISAVQGATFSISDLPEITLNIPAEIPVTRIELPDDPWKNMKGKQYHGIIRPSSNRPGAPIGGGTGCSDLSFAAENNQPPLESPVDGANSGRSRTVSKKDTWVLPHVNIKNIWEQIFRKH